MIKILDAAFKNYKSMSAKGENSDLEPIFFSWYRGPDYRPICFFTDNLLRQAKETEAKIKVAWLLEPYPFRQGTYDYVFSHLDEFDYVLTYSKKYFFEFGHVPAGSKGHYGKVLIYPYGGSMIRQWDLFPKTKPVSIIVSGKKSATGHKLRHKIVQEFGDRIDVLGSGYGPRIDKIDGLRDYKYSIVVQGERLDWCFDEKLIDCFATGTIPIYWGCPEIDTFFNVDGIVPFYDLNDLGAILDRLPPVRQDVMIENMERAEQYVCVEDWLWGHYPFLFEEA